MKKLLIVLLVFSLLLVGCSVNFSVTNSNKSIANVEEVVDALLMADREKVLNLMHTGVGISQEDMQYGIDQIITVLGGKAKAKLEQKRFNVTTRVGTDPYKEERGEYLLTTTDGAVYAISYTYLENESDSGMAGFHVSQKKDPNPAS